MILNDLLFLIFASQSKKKLIILNANCERKSYKKVFSFRSIIIQSIIKKYSNVSVKFAVVVIVVVFKSSAWRNEERERKALVRKI